MQVTVTGQIGNLKECDIIVTADAIIYYLTVTAVAVVAIVV